MAGQIEREQTHTLSHRHLTLKNQALTFTFKMITLPKIQYRPAQ